MAWSGGGWKAPRNHSQAGWLGLLGERLVIEWRILWRLLIGVAILLLIWTLLLLLLLIAAQPLGPGLERECPLRPATRCL